MEAAKPTPEHLWLQKIVGDWTFESAVDMGPDNPAIKTTGTEQVRGVGSLFILCEGKSVMPGGGGGTMFLTLGFDPQKGHFVGTWIGSMMSNMWVYEGKLDAATDTLTLDTEGPSMKDEGKLDRYRETIVVKSDSERTFSSSVRAADGTWKTFMTSTYRRVK
jgi:surface antigen